MENEHCPLCGAKRVRSYCAIDHSVTSAAGLLDLPCHTLFCPDCLNMFKVRNSCDQGVIAGIYENYVLHGVEGQVETRVAFDRHPEGMEKSRFLLDALLEHTTPAPQGRMLDIGCHFGSFLNFFHAAFLAWDKIGFDISPRFHAEVEGISANCRFEHRGLDYIGGEFDLITMTHVLEHLKNPLETLAWVRGHLRKEGVFFLQCNNLCEKPFLPIIFEQHFNYSPTGVLQLLTNAGLIVETLDCDWIGKEISVIARPAGDGSQALMCSRETDLSSIVTNEAVLPAAVETLRRMRLEEIDAVVFGTSYTGRWIGYGLGPGLRCFIDESPLLQGKTILGVPVLGPEKIDQGDRILLAFPPHQATGILQRLRARCGGLWCPPPFAECLSPTPGSGRRHDRLL